MRSYGMGRENAIVTTAVSRTLGVPEEMAEAARPGPRIRRRDGLCRPVAPDGEFRLLPLKSWRSSALRMAGRESGSRCECSGSHNPADGRCGPRRAAWGRGTIRGRQRRSGVGPSLGPHVGGLTPSHDAIAFGFVVIATEEGTSRNKASALSVPRMWETLPHILFPGRSSPQRIADEVNRGFRRNWDARIYHW
jgi:hypothetical protein